MNQREIVLNAMKRRASAACPYNIDLTEAMREKLRQHYGLARAEEVSARMGNYCAQLNIGSVTGPSEGLIPEIRPVPLGPDTARDDWGVIWRYAPGDDLGVVVDPPLKEPSLVGFTPPRPAPRGRHLAAFCKANPERFRLVALSSPVFQRAWFLRGFENFLTDMALEPAFAHELIDVIMAYTNEVVDEALSYDIDALFLMDDWGQQEGLLFSPEMWRTFVKPSLSSLCRKVKRAGRLLFLHSCGNIEVLIPELIEMGVDVLNPFQPEVMDVYALKRTYGRQLSFYGGIGTQRLLPQGTVAEVKADVREKVRRLGEGGGFLLAPAHAVQADVPIENVLALIDVMRSQG